MAENRWVCRYTCGYFTLQEKGRAHFTPFITGSRVDLVPGTKCIPYTPFPGTTPVCNPLVLENHDAIGAVPRLASYERCQAKLSCCQGCRCKGHPQHANLGPGSSYKWSCNSYKCTYEWVTVVIIYPIYNWFLGPAHRIGGFWCSRIYSLVRLT